MDRSRPTGFGALVLATLLAATSAYGAAEPSEQLARQHRAEWSYPPAPEFSGLITVSWDWSQTAFGTTRTENGSITLEPVRGDTVRNDAQPPTGMDYRVVSLTSSGTRTSDNGTGTCTITNVLDDGANQFTDGLVDSIDFYIRPHTWQTTAYLSSIHVIATGSCPGKATYSGQTIVELDKMSLNNIMLDNQVAPALARYRILTDTTAYSSAENGYTSTVRVVADLTRLAPGSPYSQYPTIEVTENVPPPKDREVSPGYVMDRVIVRTDRILDGAVVAIAGELGQERPEGVGVFAYAGEKTNSQGVSTTLVARRISRPPCYSAEVIPQNVETVAGQSDIVCAGPAKNIDPADAIDKILSGVKVAGTAKVGRTLKLKGLITSYRGTILYHVTWTAGTKIVRGATKPRLKIAAPMRGKVIRVKVTANSGQFKDNRTIQVGRVR